MRPIWWGQWPLRWVALFAAVMNRRRSWPIFLRAKKLLLVVDNFEHLLDGAPLLTDLLAAAPELLLLATSREALGLPAEWLYPLGGLAPPLPTDPLPALAHNAAVQLFVQRAQQAAPGFALNAENAAHVGDICRLVNGMLCFDMFCVSSADTLSIASRRSATVA